MVSRRMRYTTVIDIRENTVLYKNHNTRLLYFHMCLISGYHDDDRDQVPVSIRSLAIGAGLTVSAVRNALKQLQAAGMVTKLTTGFVVKKWVAQPQVTPRTQKTTARAAAVGADGRQYELEREEYARRVEAAVAAMSDDDIRQWIEELDMGRSLRHGGVQLNANQSNVEWLKSKLKRK